MYQQLYEEIVRFASSGDLAPHLAKARAEYEQRTGQLLESDPDFERRIAAFLEWYVLDRPLDPGGLTPVQLLLDASGNGEDDERRQQLGQLAHTTLSLFEFRRIKGEHVQVTDVLTGEAHEVWERRHLAGLTAGDILEARLVVFDGRVVFTETWVVHPRRARAMILKAAKASRRAAKTASQTEVDIRRLDFVHRVAYLANRSQRYRHVDPEQIFAELHASATAA